MSKGKKVWEFKKGLYKFMMDEYTTSKQNGRCTASGLESPQTLNDCKNQGIPRDSSIWGFLCFFFDLIA